MTEEETKEYHRQYYLKNKDKIAGQSKQYYIKNKDKIVERCRQYSLKNKDKILERKKRYCLENKEKIAEQMKQYYIKHKDKIAKQRQQRHLKNKEKEAEQMKQYRLENKEKLAEQMKQYYYDKYVCRLGIYFRKNYSRYITLENFISISKNPNESLKRSVMIRLSLGSIDQDEAVVIAGVQLTNKDHELIQDALKCIKKFN